MGVPIRAFLPGGSEVVSSRGIDKALHQPALLWVICHNACLHHSLMEKIYHNRQQMSIPVEEKERFSRKNKLPAKVRHRYNYGCVLFVIM